MMPTLSRILGLLRHRAPSYVADRLQRSRGSNRDPKIRYLLKLQYLTKVTNDDTWKHAYKKSPVNRALLKLKPK